MTYLWITSRNGSFLLLTPGRLGTGRKHTLWSRPPFHSLYWRRSLVGEVWDTAVLFIAEWINLVSQFNFWEPIVTWFDNILSLSPVTTGLRWPLLLVMLLISYVNLNLFICCMERIIILYLIALWRFGTNFKYCTCTWLIVIVNCYLKPVWSSEHQPKEILCFFPTGEKGVLRWGRVAGSCSHLLTCNW